VPGCFDVVLSRLRSLGLAQHDRGNGASLRGPKGPLFHRSRHSRDASAPSGEESASRGPLAAGRILGVPLRQRSRSLASAQGSHSAMAAFWAAARDGMWLGGRWLRAQAMSRGNEFCLFLVKHGRWRLRSVMQQSSIWKEFLHRHGRDTMSHPSLPRPGKPGV
jgi:hypothetical protein